MRVSKGLVGLAMFTGALMASGAALAGPITVVGGIDVPVGSVTIGQFDYENQVGVPGDLPTLNGYGIVTSITPGGGGSPTYTFGFNGGTPAPFLYDEFTGFNLTQANVIATSNGGFTLVFTGGQLGYYTSNTDLSGTLAQIASGTFPFSPTNGAMNAATYIQTNGTLWATLTPQNSCETITTSGNVTEQVCGSLLVNLPGGSTPQAVSDSQGIGSLNIIGGPADPTFSTCAMSDPANPAGLCPATLVDFSFTGGPSNIVPPPGTPPSAGDVFLSGNDFLKTVAVPEPMTMSLLGAGLIGAAALRRRKAKKA
jgi:hypothetical protein